MENNNHMSYDNLALYDGLLKDLLVKLHSLLQNRLVTLEELTEQEKEDLVHLLLLLVSKVGLNNDYKIDWEGKYPADYSVVEAIKHIVIEVIDNLESTSSTASLSARMGHELNERINNLASIGRYLSIWNCQTGLPATNPPSLPYTYKTGDYFIVGAVASEFETNYCPSGDIYDGSASTTPEIHEIHVNDMYFYDGTIWKIQLNHQKSIAIDESLSTDSINPVQNKVITNALNNVIETKATKSTTLAGYGITDTYTKSQVDAKIASPFKVKGTATVSEINALDSVNIENGTIYIMKDTGNIILGNIDVVVGDSIIFSDGRWQKLAASMIDMSAYYTADTIEGLFARMQWVEDRYYNKKEVDAKVTTLYVPKGSVYPSDLSGIPSTIGYVYNMLSAGTIDLPAGALLPDVQVDKGDNVVWVAEGWDKLASDISLDNYYTKAETQTYVNNITNGKADKSISLAGYGIQDAYTKDQVNNTFATKQELIDDELVISTALNQLKVRIDELEKHLNLSL